MILNENWIVFEIVIWNQILVLRLRSYYKKRFTLKDSNFIYTHLDY